MFVYLKCGNMVKKIPDVTLQDCYKPTVGECVEDRIEPVLWFKVLVLKAVFVDCDQRAVYWSIDDDERARAIYEDNNEHVSTDGILTFFYGTEKLMAEDCYDFDPSIDELFDTAGNVFRCLDADESLNWQENLLKMLHVYILPKVKFAKKHSDLIRDVLHLIEVQHEEIEDKIQKKDMTKKNTETSLKKQRERILKNEDFSRMSYIATLSEKFLNVFLQHLEKDIRKMNEEFVSSGTEVEQLRDSFKGNERKRLSEKRIRRDDIYEDLQKSIAAREEIKNVISRNHVKKFRKKSKRRSSHTVFHEVYMEVSMRLQGMSKDIQNLINIKIKLSSVREAVLLSVRELEIDGETFGFNRKKGSFEIEADLYDPHNKPEEWSTLEEKVKLFLTAKQLGMRTKFEKFCATINDKCQRLFDESKLFTISLAETCEIPETPPPLSPGTEQRLTLAGAASVDRRSALNRDSEEPTQMRRRFATTYTSRWSFGTIPKESCESICHDIIEHLSTIAKELAVEIKRNEPEIPHSFICKVYICYEEHVSSKLMPVLNELYEHSYKEKCDSLANWIARTPMSEFGFGQNIVANFLHTVSSESSSETNSRETSSEIKPLEEDAVVPNPKAELVNTLGNRSIKDMTLEQLYSLSDPDLPPMYHGFMDNDDVLVSSDENSDDSFDTSKFHQMDFCSVSQPMEERPANTTDSTFDASETHPKVCCDSENEAKQKFVTSGVEIGVASETLLNESYIASQIKQTNSVNHSDYSSATSETHPKVYYTDTKSEQKKSVLNGVEIGVEWESSTNESYVVIPDDIIEESSEFVMKESFNELEKVELRPKPSKAPPKPNQSALMPITLEQFYEHFKDFEKFIQEEDEACTLFKKLRTLTKALKYIEVQISDVRKNSGVDVQVCSDDLLDIIIMLLCQTSPKILLKLYSHMNLLLHLKPNFMEGSAHDYALITFCGAFQHLFEQKVLNNNASIG